MTQKDTQRSYRHHRIAKKREYESDDRQNDQQRNCKKLYSKKGEHKTCERQKDKQRNCIKENTRVKKLMRDRKTNKGMRERMSPPKSLPLNQKKTEIFLHLSCCFSTC